MVKNVKNKPKTKSERDANTTDTELPETRLVKVNFGKPVLDIQFRTIKIVTFITIVLLIMSVLFALQLFRSAIDIANHLGYFINMVATGEGTKLPIFQSIPPLFTVFVNIASGFFLFRLFRREAQPKLNNILFLLIIIHIVLIFVTFIILFIIMGHIYGNNSGIHDGIVEAMNNYSSNSAFKRQIDRLQIEFQCCGSKKYDEWYSIEWYDTSLIKTSKRVKRKSDNKKIGSSTEYFCESCQADEDISDNSLDTEKKSKGQILNKGSTSGRKVTETPSNTRSSTFRSTTSHRKVDSSKGNTPFSCCSISSLFPCIHHNIEITGKGYLYTPEQNLSISTDGCHTKLTRKTIQVGWNIIGNLILLILLQIALIIGLRILQTAHFASSQFQGHSRPYTIWLFGKGSVIPKNAIEKEVPPIPPIPIDLMS